MRIGLALSLLLATQPALAQDALAPETPPTEIQLEFLGDGPRMTVPVTIAGAGPYAFIIDTGAQRTVISHQLAAKLGLAAGPVVRLTAMTGTSSVGTVVIPSLSVSVIGANRIEAPSLDARDMGAAGILGIDTLQQHSLAIDFDTDTMTISPARKRSKRTRSGPDEIVIEAKSLFGQLVVTDAYAGATRIRVILDTGTSVSLGNEALRRRVMLGAKGVPIRMLSVTGGLLTADYTALSRFRIGDLTISDLPVAFADAPPFRAFGVEKKPALLLGMDALKLFRRVHIDFANRELRLALPRGTTRLREPPFAVSSRD